MKFRAKLKFKGEKNAGHLIQAFFKDFNPESTILIKGNDANVEIFFDQPPLEIISAISYCEVIEFNYGEIGEECDEDQIQQIVKEDEKVEQSNELDSLKKQERRKKETEPKKTELKKPGRKRTEKKVADVKQSVVERIPELDEIAKKSTSYEDFVKSVSTWLELGQREEIFQNFLKSAEQAEQITWKNIKEILKSNKVNFVEWDQIFCSKKVAEKFEGSKDPVTILKLIKAIVKYKTFDFICKEVVKKDLTVEEDVSTKNRVKMLCLPEIPSFEEVLGSVDKTQPIEERVGYVLTAMGLKKKKANEQNQIFEIANTAVRLREMSFDIIFIKANIPMESSMNAKMTFSTFLNDFVKEYDCNKKVKVLEFLKELQKIVVFESEMEDIEDFMD